MSAIPYLITSLPGVYSASLVKFLRSKHGQVPSEFPVTAFELDFLTRRQHLAPQPLKYSLNSKNFRWKFAK
jgi:hypothetical protein